jgi:hypothetical protein
VGVRVFVLLLTDENADHLKTFIANFQVFDFGSLQDSILGHYLVQLTIVYVIRHHVLSLSWIAGKQQNILIASTSEDAAEAPNRYLQQMSTAGPF